MYTITRRSEETIELDIELVKHDMVHHLSLCSSALLLMA